MSSSSITEWEFTASVASWVNALLAKNPSLPFSEARCEQRGHGSQKRRDLTLLDTDGNVVLTGEVKLPDRKDGGSPYNTAVVKDARAKALGAGARFFFTWNVNECVLWETGTAGATWKDQNYKAWRVTTISQASHLNHPSVELEIQTWLASFLADVARALRGTGTIGQKSPDERFIDALESSLRMPITLTVDALDGLYKRQRVKTELDAWMRDEQGWVIYTDPNGVRDNLERAAKFACYALVNKVVFHEALLKRYAAAGMEKITVPAHVDTGEALRLHLEGFFADARRVTRDYETVFGESHTNVGSRIPFYADGAVPHWTALVEEIHEFDFSQLDYEVVGNIFERLIGPEERHKYGQFYTRVEVVDLMNSFAIPSGAERVMDPACGGGTFLVRAYARKRELMPGRKHGELLTELYGVDVSHFATHLTTINLATRDLIDDENYPRIARSDFFDVEPKKRFITLPRKLKAKGLGVAQHQEIEIPILDAVVGNPPYVRQEDIPATPKGASTARRGTKEFYRSVAARGGSGKLSGRSDIHVYFWPHAATFLKDDGYLCFITSSQWLDAEYGFRLQEWILRNFEIVSIFESLDEPWFVGARVATAVTILRRQRDTAVRARNVVRFVQIRRPMRDVLSHDGTTAGALAAADALRDEILALRENTTTDRYRARLVTQGDLWRDGVRLGLLMSKSEPAENGEDDTETSGSSQDGDYSGGKWGVFLRAPDLWFDLLDQSGGQFAPLGDIASLRRGITSGSDTFFYPRDRSAACLAEEPDPTEFENTFSVPRSDVASGRVRLVACGEDYGEIRPIEARFLEPEVHSLMEVDGFIVQPSDCARFVILVGESKRKLKDTFVLDYIKWGERVGIHMTPTCAARATEDREWYDLTGRPRGSLFWSKAQQYKHVVPLNENDLQCNCNLYDLHLPPDIDAEVMAGILNSSVVVLSKFQYGRPAGVEGNLKTEVIDTNMMLVPDPRGGDLKSLKRVARAFGAMKNRKALGFLSERRLRTMAYTAKGKDVELAALSEVSELQMADRRELDDAVFELLGVRSKERRRQLIDELYDYLGDMFEAIRQKEERAIVNKKTAKRQGRVQPADVAAQILEHIKANEGHLLRRYDTHFLDKGQPFDTLDLPAEGAPAAHQSLFNPHGIAFQNGRKSPAVVDAKSDAQVPLVILLAETGVRGLVRVPRSDEECQRLYDRYGKFVRSRNQRIRELVEERTADPEIQERVVEALGALIAQDA